MWVACVAGTNDFIAAFPMYYAREECVKILTCLGLAESEYDLNFDENYPDNSNTAYRF